MVNAVVGMPLTLDASASADRDGNDLTFEWFFYPEAGSGIPGHPVFEGGFALRFRLAQVASRRRPKVGRRSPRPRDARGRRHITRHGDTAHLAGTAHVILAVTDDGQPSLTSYRRMILTIASGRKAGFAASASP